ncbi:hypothetical protein DUNSADRAFT_2580 [Dunaliella salina]|uniref:Encoded protein n=1 Tax=Dunaliella salina TaxID=3046 RepID=A0ABQ7GVH4_DUNSA|nr:hypothetical protein DUNSADRAFT_2580 [Dunaliella salina]|eukprot:KAF5838595.1 hypothetical protein DUNSADRAFT_2580 [Dunaliella salina]
MQQLNKGQRVPLTFNSCGDLARWAWKSAASAAHSNSHSSAACAQALRWLCAQVRSSGFTGKTPTLFSFFPNSLARVCQAAGSSKLYLRRDQHKGSREQQPQDAVHHMEPSEEGGQVWPGEPQHYDIHDLMLMAVQPHRGLAGFLGQARLPEMQDSSQIVGTYVPAVSARRTLLGSGTFKGHYSLQLELGSYKASGAMTLGPRLLCVYQTIPWFVRLWVHTLVVMLEDKVVLPHQMAYHHLQPSVDRVSPLILEFCLEVPPGKQSVSITADFTKHFLTVFEHLPDAHRGFDIPAAIISYMSNESCHEAPCIHEEFSDGSLVQLATPDFSMPYNVICLSSTVMGVFVGSTLNTLVFRPGKLLSMDAGSRKRRKIRLAVSTVLLLALGFALALHVDKDFAGQVDSTLQLLDLPSLSLS